MATAIAERTSLVRYERAPSRDFVELLKRTDFIARIRERGPLHGHQLDVHFRERDCLGVYCGMTRVLEMRRVGDCFELTAAPKYRECAPDLFQTWSSCDSAFDSQLNLYLSNVTIEDRWLAKEGRVHTDWASIRDSWIPIDREAVLGYPDKASQQAARRHPKIDQARARVELSHGHERWATYKDGKVAAKLDQLAVDPQGRVVLLELKHGRASAVYYSPLQVLQYAWEWSRALDQVHDRLQATVDARIELGLSPVETPRLRNRLRPVVGFGQEAPKGIVGQRLQQVVGVVNGFLPDGCEPIEVRMLDGTGPGTAIG